MKATKHTITANGHTFTRWNYTGRPTLHERRNGITTESINAASPWSTFIHTDEINSDLAKTGEQVGVEIKIWPTAEVIKVEGAERFDLLAAAELAKALTAAAQLLDEMAKEERCPRHGATWNPADGPGFDCDGCFEEMSAELDEQQRRTQIAANAFSR